MSSSADPHPGKPGNSREKNAMTLKNLFDLLKVPFECA